MKYILSFLLLVGTCIASPSLRLDHRLVCDLEMMMDGAFDPVEKFMGEADYQSVLDNCHLSNGKLWPLPIVLPISSQEREKIEVGSKVILRDVEFYPLAELTVEEIYSPNVERECQAIYGCCDTNHEYIRRILSYRDHYYVSGSVKRLARARHFNHEEYRLTPKMTREHFAKNGWSKVVGFQTRNPLHRCHMALTQYCLKQAGSDAKLLLQPVVGMTQAGDIDADMRVACYKALLKYYDPGVAKLSIIPLSMRMAGPREAMWHALVRKNYGCTHFVVGRDHAGPSVKKQDGTPFFDPYGAHGLLAKHREELGIKIIPSLEIVYVPELNDYLPANEVPADCTIARISGTQFREMLRSGEEVPEWFSFPEVISILKKSQAPSSGVCVYFVGLSGSGKSTICRALEEKIQATSGRKVVTLDGDVVRKYISNGLGFSRKDRSINVRRIGYVAAQVVRSEGICLCANIAPYEEDRLANRELVGGQGCYVEVYVATPLETCEHRDVKGLYALAREGKIKEFTGISDPFELPEHADIVLDGSKPLEEVTAELFERLEQIAPQIFTE